MDMDMKNAIVGKVTPRQDSSGQGVGVASEFLSRGNGGRGGTGAVLLVFKGNDLFVVIECFFYFSCSKCCCFLTQKRS